jgi:hypothetical protein
MKRILRVPPQHDDHASLLRALYVPDASMKLGKMSPLAPLPAHDCNQRGAEAHA